MPLPVHVCPECFGEESFPCGCGSGCQRAGCDGGDVPCQFCAGMPVLSPARCPQCGANHGGDLHPDLAVVSALCHLCEPETSEGAPSADVSRVPGPPLVHSAPTAYGGSSGAHPTPEHFAPPPPASVSRGSLADPPFHPVAGGVLSAQGRGVPGSDSAKVSEPSPASPATVDSPAKAQPAPGGLEPLGATPLDDERRDSVARRWEADAKPCPRCEHPVLYRHEGGRRVPLNRSATAHACPPRRTA